MTHIPIAILMQFIISFVINVWAGAIFATAFYMGREVSQAEYRNIKNNYGGKRENMPWWGGLQRRAWTTKGLLDWILPSVAVLACAFFAEYILLP
jgi:hypothetical protein